MNTSWPELGKGTPPESVVVSGPCRQPLELNTWRRCPCSAMYWYTPLHYYLAAGWLAALSMSVLGVVHVVAGEKLTIMLLTCLRCGCSVSCSHGAALECSRLSLLDAVPTFWE